MKLKVFIDCYGRIGICEKFEDIEENCGLNELLDELVDNEFWGDRYSEFAPGFYTAKFVVENHLFADPQDHLCYIQIDEILEEL